MTVPALKQQQALSWQPVHLIVPGIVGCMMLAASFLPWLNDPLGTVYSAWHLPVDIGWQFQSGLFNYGLLCTGSALYAFFIAYSRWQCSKEPAWASRWRAFSSALSASMVPVGLLCLFPVLLFLEQYLLVDVHDMDVLTQHTVQLLLIRQHLGYNIASQLITLQPFAVTSSTLLGRLEVLVNQTSGGLLLPCIGALIALGYTSFFVLPSEVVAEKRRRNKRIAILAVGLLVALVVFGRAPLAMVCEYQAREALVAGNYTRALQWLDAARTLNPALDQVSYYHRERGQAWYYLHPGEENDDSHVYLAATYREQQDYLAAYQELLAVWHVQPQSVPAWLVADMSTTLEQLAEFTQQGHATPPVLRANLSSDALPWLQMLSQVDSSNVYSHYVMGRIDYAQHSYDDCIVQMGSIVRLNYSLDLRSAAYTYIALSLIGQGNSAEARKVLFEAVVLDPYYHNNTAREELSGLH
jgi:tetratricopeptide (TPR) repeat protein